MHYLSKELQAELHPRFQGIKLHDAKMESERSYGGWYVHFKYYPNPEGTFAQYGLEDLNEVKETDHVFTRKADAIKFEKAVNGKLKPKRKYTKKFRKEELKHGHVFAYLDDATEAVKVESIDIKHMDGMLENTSYKTNWQISDNGIQRAYMVTLKHSSQFLHPFCFIVEDKVTDASNYTTKQRRYMHIVYPNGNVEGWGYEKMLGAVDHALQMAIWNTYSKDSK